MTPLPKISSLFVELDTLDPNSRLSISWDPVTSNLTMSYTIRYGLAGSNQVRSVSTSDDRLSCRQEPVGPYRCYLTSSLLLEDQMYTFQVAAVNGYRVGPFSSTVSARLQSQEGILHIIIILL